MFGITARVHHLRDRVISVVGEPNDPVIGGFNFPEYSGTFDFTWQLPTRLLAGAVAGRRAAGPGRRRYLH